MSPVPTPDPLSLLIVGGGPAGLSLASAAADAGLRPTVIEPQSAEALADPAPDGREIALTHRARALLQALGQWQRLGPQDIAPIRRAEVHNGDAQGPARAGLLQFDAQASGHEALGFLVPNHRLRQVAWEAARARPAVRFVHGASVVGVQRTEAAASVTLSDGQVLAAPLVVAADSRFSNTRRALGIGAQSLDFGRTVIVARLHIERPHDGVAHECFGWRRTLALLPLQEGLVSAVVTLSSGEAPAFLALSDADFSREVQTAAGQRLGRMAVVGPRHAYPLVAVYAQRFSTHRAALLGDAAVGMHPVTAHGYNFGLYGAEVLARTLDEAARQGRDIGTAALLARYAHTHRRVTWTTYHGTNALVRLYTQDQPAARLLRELVLRAANRLPPLKAAITAQLTDHRPAHGQSPSPAASSFSGTCQPHHRGG